MSRGLISSPGIDSLKSLFSLWPKKPPPRYTLYLPGFLPTNPISAMNGLPHPFGHPVMRMVMASCLRPQFSSISSRSVMRSGR